MNGWAAVADAAADPTRRLESALADPAAQQTVWLLDLLAQNAETRFGKRHRFGSIASVADYRSRVPIAPYEGLAEDIEALADGAQNVLTAEPVIAFEETAGTTAGRKLIPYTRTGLADIEAAILPWLQGLADAHPAIVGGAVYWSAGPIGRRPARTRGGAPIGFASDAGYVSAPVASALCGIAAVPMELTGIKDIAAWRYLTLRTLLSREDLTCVSIWSPTFLSLLLDAMPAMADRLLGAIHDGVVGCDTPASRHCTFKPQPQRARRLAEAIRTCDASRLWPHLALISAWADGPARGAFAGLRRRLPQIEFDAKGLMATEGVVSLRLARHTRPVPALTAAFLEFVDARGRPHLAHELKAGVTYRTVITTRSGLYRYDLGDEVVCREAEHGIAGLEFLGRCGVVADMAGEKLAEAFAAAALAGVEGYPILAPVAAGEPHYVVLLEAPLPVPQLAREIESRLAANPHYAYARRIGQLGPLQARTTPGLRAAYHRWRLAEGQALGTIKPPVLLRSTDETARLLSFLPGAASRAA
jgi:hypothetical protein